MWLDLSAFTSMTSGICQLEKPILLQVYEWIYVGLYPFVMSILDFNIWLLVCVMEKVQLGVFPDGSSVASVPFVHVSPVAAHWSRTESCTCCSHTFAVMNTNTVLLAFPSSTSALVPVSSTMLLLPSSAAPTVWQSSYGWIQAAQKACQFAWCSNWLKRNPK